MEGDQPPTPPHSDDSTIPSSSVQTVIHQEVTSVPAVAVTSPSINPPNASAKPAPAARQQVPGANANELRAPPLPASAAAQTILLTNDLHSSNQHLYNTPTYAATSAAHGGNKKQQSLLANSNGSIDPKDDVEIFSSHPIVVHVPKKKGGTKDSASASSSIDLLTGGGADGYGGGNDTAGHGPLGGRRDPAGKRPTAAGRPNSFAGQRRRRAATVCIWLAVGQLLCSVCLTSVGVLMWTRGATFAHGAAGLWAGAFCGVAGALGVINERMARTGFLAVSLMCVASSTLAIALTGIGLVRDLNANTNQGAVNAAAALLAALTVHFLISVLAVYYAAIQQCSSRRHHLDDSTYIRHQTLTTSNQHQNKHSNIANNTNGGGVHHTSQLSENIVYASNGAFTGGVAASNHTNGAPSTNPAHLSRQRVEQYFRSLPRDGTPGTPPSGSSGNALMKHQQAHRVAKGNSHGVHDKMMPVPIWTSSGGKQPAAASFAGTLPSSGAGRPVVLVPAGLGANLLPVYHPTHMQQPQMLYPMHLAPPGMLPYHHPHSHPHHPYTASLMRGMPHPHHQYPHPHHPHNPHVPHHQLDAALLHPSGGVGTAKAARHQRGARRRKSESDRTAAANNGTANPAFVYHGLDRAIADSFLEQQERQNVSMDCTSLSGRGADVRM